jgi:hypothetical protein
VTGFIVTPRTCPSSSDPESKPCLAAKTLGRLRLAYDASEVANNPPAPEIIARETVEHLTAALAESEAVAAALEAAAGDKPSN